MVGIPVAVEVGVAHYSSSSEDASSSAIKVIVAR
jgi:hypothetical protein